MALFIYDPLPLKEVEEKQHPWARTINDVYAHRIKHGHNSIKNPIYPSKKEKQPNPDRVRFTVIGDRVTKEFTYCANLVKGLYKYRWRNFEVPIIRDLNTIEWLEVLHDLKLRFGGTTYCLQSSVAVLMNDKFVGGEKELQLLVETKLFYYLCLDYYNEGVAEFARFIRSTNRPFVYMHVSINNDHIGTLIYMLYADIVPYTCENFLRLCNETKGGYGGTPVHRIVKDGWIQCGGFALKSTPLSCENFIVPFDRRGVLAMTNDGRDNDCSTQFFVLLQPAPWMNNKYVAIGQLIEGAATLEKIEKVITWYESPRSKIILYRCGVLNLECHDIRIHKGTNQYIDGHTEDLNTLAELLWETLIEKTFLEAQLRELERMRAMEGEGAVASSQIGEPAVLPDDNHDFDVEEIEFKEEEEEQDDSYRHLSMKSVSTVVKSSRPYFIPLTDVPYPGDVDSDFDLKKFLKGDYCLKSDLSSKKDEAAVIPSELWIDSESSTSTSDELSLGSEEQEELDKYIKENVDKVSFAGEVIKNITQAKKDANHYRHNSIPDEKLRKIRLSAAQYRQAKKHRPKVSMMAPSAHGSKKKEPSFQRRPTGFIKPQDLAKFINMYGDSDDDEDDTDVEEQGKATGITFSQRNTKTGASRPIMRRLTTYVKSTKNYDDDDDDDDDDDVEVVEEESRPKSKKESILLRLYDTVKFDNKRGPTLKNYIPTAEFQHKNLLELTHYTPLFEANDNRDLYKQQEAAVKSGDSLDRVLYLRHGARMSRKISNDNYVNTTEKEDNKPRSIRTVEYARKRPTISVSDYQLENMRYQEQLKRKASLSWWVSFLESLFLFLP